MHSRRIDNEPRRRCTSRKHLSEIRNWNSSLRSRAARGKGDSAKLEAEAIKLFSELDEASPRVELIPGVTVADVDIDCLVHDIDRTSDRCTVLVKTFAGDYLRVETQWAGGWLDPQVDRLKPAAEERQPLGELQGIETV